MFMQPQINVKDRTHKIMIDYMIITVLNNSLQNKMRLCGIRKI